MTVAAIGDDNSPLEERYQIIRQLGKKAGRKTLLVRHRQTQQLAVIKLLTFNEDFEWEQLKLFKREAQTLQHLSHPAIPQYLDFFEIEQSNSKGFALVQSYIDAPSLEEQLDIGRSFSEAEIKQLAESVLEILNYLHSQHPPVIHRDIKPSNILLTNRSEHSIGQVCLVDFGSVQSLVATQGGTITVVGTYGYMPLEQFGGRAVPASDLYSLGATLIYLVTGTHPADLPQRDLRIQFEAVANVSSAMSSWLKRLIEPSLDSRFNTVHEALEALKKEPQDIEIKDDKPVVSKVSCVATAEAIEIVVPAKKQWNPEKLDSILIGICIFSFSSFFCCLSYLLFLLLHFSLITVILGWLPATGLGLFVAYQCMLRLFGR